MHWDTELKTPLLGKDGGAKQLQQFLLLQMPPFRAPTDVASWKRERARLRKDALAKVFLKGFPARAVRSKPRVVWGEVLRPDASYVVRKLRYEVFPDYWIPAALYEPTARRAPMPVFLNPNGHHQGGKAAIYKQVRCANLARRGIAALNMEFIGMSELGADRLHNNIAYVDWTGLAGVGLFYLALQKGLDILLALPRADASRVGTTGLSGGGWQSIVIASLDERVTLCVPVAGYTAIRARVGCYNDIGDLEQTPADLTSVFDYPHMTAMLAPRPALVILNENDDCCFKTERARPIVYDAVRPTYVAMNAADKFATYSNKVPGTHNYDADNRSRFYRFLNEHWSLNAPEQDIHDQAELFTERELSVGLPENQQTVLSIAAERGKALVRKHKTPRTTADRNALRKRLIEILRLPHYDVKPRRGKYQRGISRAILRVGPWKVPMSVQIPSDAPAAETDLFVGETGRADSSHARVATRRNKIAVDILGTGENRCDDRHLMLIDATGKRFLGERVAQILACARHAAVGTGAKRIHLTANGVTCSVAGLIAAALEPHLFASLTTTGLVTTLLNLIAWGERYEAVQGVFCFGLLEVADITQLVALLEKVELRQPDRRVKSVPGK